MSGKLGGSLNGWVLFAENLQKHVFLLLMEPTEVELPNDDVGIHFMGPQSNPSVLTAIPEPQELRGWAITKDLVEFLYVRFKEDADLLAEDDPSGGPLLEIVRIHGDGLMLRQDGKRIHIAEKELGPQTLELVSQIDHRAARVAESIEIERNVSDFVRDVNWVINELITIVEDQTSSDQFQRKEVLIKIVDLQMDLLALDSPDSVLDPERLALLRQAIEDLKRLAPAAYAKFEELLLKPAIGAGIGLAVARFLTT